MGALGSDDPVWNDTVGRRLLGQSEPDLAPNRVALYVCPECGGMSCGALTAALTIEDAIVIWSDFRWERDWQGAPDDHPLHIGPFEFSRAEYEDAISTAVRTPASTVRPSDPPANER